MGLTRIYDSKLIAWCPDCLYHVDAKEIGVKCDDFAASDCQRTLVKRRMWVCAIKDCQQAYKTLIDAQQHECYSAY